MDQHLPPPVPIAPAKATYRVTNWPDYNRALVSRGTVTLWLHEAVLRDWRATGGKGKRYSDTAILCALSLRALSLRAIFKLPLRQAEGLLRSFKAMLGLTIPVPHYATLSRRAADLAVPELARGPRDGLLHLAIDSTGLKLFGEGEWKMRQHGKGKRRVWRKLHLVVDTQTGHILAHALTGSECHDAPQLPSLLEKVEGQIEVVTADKGYDSFACHRAILSRKARPVIPPRAGAAIAPDHKAKDPPNTRGDAVRRICEIGARAWKAETGYHRRSLAETAMARYKAIVGPNLKSRNRDTQITEAAIAIRCINTFTAIGMPKAVKTA